MITAKIKLQVAIMLARDIQALKAGDTSRFDRMVDNRGKGVINLGAAIHVIKAICIEVAAFYPVTSRALLNWLQAVNGGEK